MSNKENAVKNPTKNNPISFLSVIYKNLVLIILITILCGLCGALYGFVKVKPVYTASRSVILRTSVKLEEDRNSASNDATLAKIYLGEVEKALKAPDVISYASDIYNKQGDVLSSGAVSVNYGTESLIFKVSYTDVDEETASNKLGALIDAAADRLEELIMAEEVTLINVQKEADISVNSSFDRFVVLGAVAGILISLAIVAIRYGLDNTVKDKSEYEYLTGVSVIALIDEVQDK